MNNTLSYVTLAGLPLLIELRWPFHRSQSGGDFDVLHGVVTLADGSELHANVSVHLSASIRELLPSLDQSVTEPMVVNALRKWADKKEFEFLKSTKLQPLPLSSRFLSFKSKQWKFEDASDEQLGTLLKDSLYWTAVKAGRGSLDLADAIEQQYTGASVDRMKAAASALVAAGYATIAGNILTPTAKVSTEAAEFEKRAATAFEQVKEKHAFEASKMSH